MKRYIYLVTVLASNADKTTVQRSVMYASVCKRVNWIKWTTEYAKEVRVGIQVLNTAYIGMRTKNYTLKHLGG